MTRTLNLTAADGFELKAYVAEPEGTPRAALVILPEIFGVNSHIRSVTDRYARHGYLAIAPNMFDRVERDLDLGYGDDDVKKGQALMRELDWDQAVLDIEAAAQAVGHAGKVGIVGYCWGGTAAWVAASRSTGGNGSGGADSSASITCAVSYYGNAITTVMDDRPCIPMMLHWGEKDHLIALADIERVRDIAPASSQTFIYPTGHGFNCDQRSLYHPESAALAEQRTLDFLKAHIG
ncbi:dienelactone hydrolase family protein [Pigmentiphaga litoralis]|uniref:Carboxymethylenebutenolidase n=1 Tax=Pigmentiphaga litoralis TaxID=516702 RepID=A0A7Y9ISD3_9BURK|nr:dienelactone hydrolase family protein [Pigmentiphaga litoralis]NYE24267.1 carboxymethylenebutenolidase [Pigmentiphaga litoralis]NYE82119.1 carboxymethylenebutenolidase [Pigmentiphaga litoralis]